MSNIALQTQLPQIDSPFQAQGKMLQLRSLAQADQEHQYQMQQRSQALLDDASYRSALQANPNGGAALLSELARAGNYKGHAAAVKADLDARKGKADIDQSDATTNKAKQETLNQAFTAHRDQINLVNDPQTAAHWVAAAYSDPVLGPLVGQSGSLETAIARIPKDPEGFARWKLQASLNAEQYVKYTTADANTRANNQTSIGNNQRTNAVTARGQNMVDRRAKQFNDITQEANNSAIVETPQGYQVVNKGTANARAVSLNGQPVLGKDSTTAKNAQMADRLTGMIPLAKQLLKSGATASGAGAIADKMLAFSGISTKGADAATALETVSGWMTSNVPRFEGPQSDKDTATYRTMAGLVGDRTQPMSTRLKALESLEALMGPYMGRRVEPYVGPVGTQPATMVAPRPAVPQSYRSPAPGAVAPAAPAPTPVEQPDIDSFFE